MDKDKENFNKEQSTLAKIDKMREKALNKEECKIIAQKLTQYLMQDKK